MAEPSWAVFVLLVLGLTVAVVVLARLSAAPLTDDDGPATESVAGLPSGRALLYNLALTQLLIAAAVFALARMTGVPYRVLGLGWPSAPGRAVTLGVGLFVVVSAVTALSGRFGVDSPDRLRRLLAPSTEFEWLLLLCLVLPAVAVAEELLFRGAFVGGLAAGTGLSPWLLAGLSAVAFGLSHAAQGRYGVVTAGAVGFVLAAAFVRSGELALVVIAHYVVDAAEFLLHEAVLPATRYRL